jgi:hypothetical protein
MQARTHHEVDGVEDTAIVVRDAVRDGARRLPATAAAALITAVHLGERPVTTA